MPVSLRFAGPPSARLARRVPQLSGPHVVAMILPPIRADYRGIEIYRPAPEATRACRVTVFTG